MHNYNNDIMTNTFELIALCTIGLITGLVAPFEMNYGPIIASIIGTIGAGTLWIFIKPMIESLQKSLYKRLTKKKK